MTLIDKFKEICVTRPLQPRDKLIIKHRVIQLWNQLVSSGLVNDTLLQVSPEMAIALKELYFDDSLRINIIDSISDIFGTTIISGVTPRWSFGDDGETLRQNMQLKLLPLIDESENTIVIGKLNLYDTFFTALYKFLKAFKTLYRFNIELSRSSDIPIIRFVAIADSDKGEEILDSMDFVVLHINSYLKFNIYPNSDNE